MPNVSELSPLVKLAEDPVHEIGPEASWSGFEVEVENDSNESCSETKSTGEDVTESHHEEIELIECIHNQSSTETNNNNCEVIVTGSSKNSRSYGGTVSAVHLHSRETPHNSQFFKMGNSSPSSDPRDEYTAFGVYVQQELRKISNPYALQMTKLKINRVLFEATTGVYDRNSSEAKPVKKQL